MKENAYAKINLAIDVFNIREDGYHDIRSIMTPIDFYDELEISLAASDTFLCNRAFIRWNPRNSIYKMIEAVKEKYAMKCHYAVRLRKVIPLQSGLGGGTADAAAALKILQKLHGLELSREEIIELCMKVGADVPFNYFNTPAIVSGIGDVIEPFQMAKRYDILLVKPRSGISTKEAYEKLDMNSCNHPDIPALKKALEEGRNIHGLLGNSLEEPALKLNGEIREVKRKLESYGIGEVLMSGSGSAVFCISEDAGALRSIADDLSNSRLYVRYTKTLN